IRARNVTGVQTCALPIYLVTMLALEPDRPDELLPLRGVVSMNGPGSMRPENLLQSRERVTQLGLTPEEIDRLDAAVAAPPVQWRSEERRVGEGWGRWGYR